MAFASYPEADDGGKVPGLAFFTHEGGGGYYDNLGWLYALPADHEQECGYGLIPGLVRTESTIYPFLFDNQRKDWLFYHGSLRGEMILYNYRREEWEKVPNQSNSQN